MRKTALFTIILSSGALLRADFTYQETTQITGGSMLAMLKMAGPFAKQAKEPTVSTHMLKGNRMVTMTRERATIIDVDKETITTVDFAKKTYSVMTFAQMKQMVDDAAARMKGNQANNTDAKVSVSAKATGQTKTIQNLEAKELLVTMTIEATDAQSGQSGSMNTVMDSWRAQVPGYDEVKAFHRRMGEKMGYLFGSGMAQMGMMRPELSKGLAEAGKESAKLDGMPVQTVLKLGGTGDAPAGDASAAPQQQQQQQQSQSSGGLRGLGGLAGGLGGLGRRKSTQQDQQPQSGSQNQSGTLMETTTELSSYSSEPVDGSKFDIPAGFKQVEPEGARRR